jgi:hypothetical protein
MAEKLGPKETVTFKELLISNMIETQTIVESLFEKGIITEQEYFTKLKQVQSEYQSRTGT